MEQCGAVAYLRRLQTADDVESCVGILVHLEAEQMERSRTHLHITINNQVNFCFTGKSLNDKVEQNWTFKTNSRRLKLRERKILFDFTVKKFDTEAESQQHWPLTPTTHLKRGMTQQLPKVKPTWTDGSNFQIIEFKAEKVSDVMDTSSHTSEVQMFIKDEVNTFLSLFFSFIQPLLKLELPLRAISHLKCCWENI